MQGTLGMASTTFSTTHNPAEAAQPQHGHAIQLGRSMAIVPDANGACDSGGGSVGAKSTKTSLTAPV